MNIPKTLDLKQLASFVMALTAMVTAITSLVKAVDKRQEQASYETLVVSIHEMQQEQAAMREELAAVKAARIQLPKYERPVDTDGDGILDPVDPMTGDVPVTAAKPPKMPPALPAPSARVPIALKPLPKWSDLAPHTVFPLGRLLRLT